MTEQKATDVLAAYDLKWSNVEKNAIDLRVLFRGIGNIVPFTASPKDSEEHGRNLFAAAVQGVYGPIKDFNDASQGEDL